MRVVVYAEGPGDAPRIEAHPTATLTEEQLGPAHHLVRRCLCEGTSLPTAAVRFEAPLRHRGRIPRGSDLLNKKILLRLLTWPKVADYPQLVVVLVDEDGKAERRASLEAVVAAETTPVVVGIPVREFESWLLADISAVAEVTGRTLDEPSAIESMAPREAKQRLADATNGHHAYAKRLAIAKSADLGRLGKLRAFEQFRKALQTVAAS